MSRVQEFIDFMMERHLIYLRKRANLEPPWTEDPALQYIYLTNVYRELDKVTVWIRKNIREPYADSPNLWFLLAAARLINLPGSLRDLLDHGGLDPNGWDKNMFVEIMKARRDKDEPLFTQAYMLWGGRTPGQPKHEVTADLLDRLWHARETIEPRLHNTLEEAWTELTRHHGLKAGFIAYEIVTDLRHTSFLNDAPDVRTWAFAGPGASRGLNWIHGRKPIVKRMKAGQALEEMRQLLTQVEDQWPADDLDGWPPLELREIEHMCCEWGKVAAYKYDGKRPKRTYKKGLP